MRVYPFLDSFGGPALFVLLALLLLLERFRPLRKRIQSWLTRILINVAVAVPSFVVLRLLLLPVVVAAAGWAEEKHFGLARVLPLPPVAAGIVAILFLDYSMYVWHWLNHRVPVLWRFHHVHHSDLDLDVSTAFRFHFGEIGLSVLVRSIQIILAGASPLVALIYEVLLEASTEFHHSNVRLPLGVERVLSWFIVTPRAHGIHHSVVAAETNSNYSNLLIVWDRLHRTLNLNARQSELTIGVADCRDPRELTVFRLLVLPFERTRRVPPRTEATLDSPSRQRLPAD